MNTDTRNANIAKAKFLFSDNNSIMTSMHLNLCFRHLYYFWFWHCYTSYSGLLIFVINLNVWSRFRNLFPRNPVFEISLILKIVTSLHFIQHHFQICYSGSVFIKWKCLCVNSEYISNLKFYSRNLKYLARCSQSFHATKLYADFFKLGSKISK